MSVIFVAVVQAIIITITNVNTWNAIAIVTSKQITEACSSFRFTVLWRLISTITAIVVSIAIPCSWNTSVIWTSEAILWACSLGTMQWIFVAVISTIVVAITKPVRFNANIRFLAFQMIRWASCICWTPFMCFI